MNTASLLSSALALHQAGAFADAEKAYRAVLVHEANNADALALLGCVLSEQKKHGAALDTIKRALALDSTAPLFHFHLGNALDKAKKFPEAEDAFLKATALAPGWDEAWYNLGNAARAQNNDAAAQQHYEKTIALNPNHILALNNLALLYAKVEAHEKAAAMINRALAIQPDNVRLLLTLNGIAFQQNDLPAAFASAQRVAEIKLNIKKGDVLGVFDDLTKLDTVDEDIRSSIFALGVSSLLQGRLAQASYIMRSLLSLEPHLSDVMMIMGSIALAQNKLGAADDAYGAAFMLDPSATAAPWNRSMPLLTAGQLGEGFRRYRWRWQALEKFKKMRLNAPMWDGGDLHGKTILVHEEQGFGDSLQMLRYLPLLKQRGAKVYFYARPVLYPLIESWEALDGVLKWNVEDKNVPAGVDTVCGGMDLPGLLGTTLARIPANVPYLPNPLAGDTRYRLDSAKPKIGLVWSGNPLHKRDHERSIPFGLWEPLLKNDLVQFYSFQFKPKDADLAAMQRFNVIDLAPHIKNLADTAAFLDQIDLLITVDSAPAHLAGALGKKVWTLVTMNPDWRWLLGRDDSPWYPSLRLFRQNQIGDWHTVMSDVVKNLAQEYC